MIIQNMSVVIGESVEAFHPLPHPLYALICVFGRVLLLSFTVPTRQAVYTTTHCQCSILSDSD